jgi:hypothetical protein
MMIIILIIIVIVIIIDYLMMRIAKLSGTLLSRGRTLGCSTWNWDMATGWKRVFMIAVVIAYL